MASKKKDKQSPNQGKSSGAGTDIPMSEKTERWVSALFIPVAVIGLLVYNAMQDSSGSLTIYPQTFIAGTTPGDNGSNGAPENHSEPSEITVIAEGIVLNDLKQVPDSSVFATLIGNAGHTYAIGSCETKSDGTFSIKGNLKTFKSFNPKELVIYAKGGKQAEQLDGHLTLHVDGQLQQRNVKISPWALVLLPGIFFLSLWVAFVRANKPKWKRLKHSTSVLLALMFTLSMIYTISSGLNYVHSEGRKSEILSLGYAFLFQGSYVDGGPEEWIFSFTWPKKLHESTSSVNGVSGNGNGDNPNIGRANNGKNIFAFGAPLWVILLSVIGASFTTVSLIVRETKETLDYQTDDKRFWARIQEIVQHQFLILFAPLGAIFVYQILVAGDAVNNPSTVALAALGAGPTVNFLLARAIKFSKSLVESNGNGGDETTKDAGSLDKNQAPATTG